MCPLSTSGRHKMRFIGRGGASACHIFECTHCFTMRTCYLWGY